MPQPQTNPKCFWEVHHLNFHLCGNKENQQQTLAIVCIAAWISESAVSECCSQSHNSSALLCVLLWNKTTNSNCHNSSSFVDVSTCRSFCALCWNKHWQTPLSFLNFFFFGPSLLPSTLGHTSGNTQKQFFWKQKWQDHCDFGMSCFQLWPVHAVKDDLQSTCCLHKGQIATKIFEAFTWVLTISFGDRNWMVQTNNWKGIAATAVSCDRQWNKQAAGGRCARGATGQGSGRLQAKKGVRPDSVTAELLAGARALSLADRHHFKLNLSDLLDKSTQCKRNLLLNAIAAGKGLRDNKPTLKAFKPSP